MINEIGSKQKPPPCERGFCELNKEQVYAAYNKPWLLAARSSTPMEE